MKKNKAIFLRVSEDLHNHIKKVCNSNGIKINDFVKAALFYWMNNYDKIVSQSLK